MRVWPATGADLDEVESWLADPETSRFVSAGGPEWRAYLGRAEVEAWAVRDGRGICTAFAQIDLEPGGAGFMQMTVAPGVRRQGHGLAAATAVLAATTARRIVATTDPLNIAAQALLVRLGFNQPPAPDADGLLAYSLMLRRS